MKIKKISREDQVLYIITNIGDNSEKGFSYIGITSKGLEKRKKQHIQKALIGKSNTIFHEALRKWTPESFSWKILAIVENFMFNKIETNAIKIYNTRIPNGYNISNGGNGSAGYTFTEEVKKKISEGQKGEKNHFFGKHHTEETKRKISKGNKDKIVSEETKRKISKSTSGEKSYMFGKHQSEEVKRKNRESNMGKTRSDETKRKISKSTSGENNPMFGKYQSEETKRKQSNSMRGKLSGEKNPRNKYKYFCSNDKNYWNDEDFTRNERNIICWMFRMKKSDTIIYRGITITRTLK